MGVTHAVPTGAAGLLLFASAQDEPRARRPTDVAMAIASLLLIVLSAALSQLADDIDLSLAELLATFPKIIEPLWLVAFWAALLWALGLVAISLLRRRGRLALDLVAGGLTSIVIAVIVAAIVTDDAGNVVRSLARRQWPPVLPARRLDDHRGSDRHRLAPPQPTVPAPRPVARRRASRGIAVPRRHIVHRCDGRHRCRSAGRGARPPRRRLPRRTADRVADRARPAAAWASTVDDLAPAPMHGEGVVLFAR